MDFSSAFLLFCEAYKKVCSLRLFKIPSSFMFLFLLMTLEEVAAASDIFGEIMTWATMMLT